MNTLQLRICECCYQPHPNDCYRPAISVCIECETLPVHAAVHQAVANTLKQMRAQSSAVMQRKEARQAAYALHGKRCTMCWGKKHPREFHRCAPRPDGLQPACIGCNTLRQNLLAAGMTREQWATVRDAMRAKNAPNGIIGD